MTQYTDKIKDKTILNPYLGGRTSKTSVTSVKTHSKQVFGFNFYCDRCHRRTQHMLIIDGTHWEVYRCRCCGSHKEFKVR